MNNTKEIENSHEFQDILSKPPNWHIRSGSTILFVFVGVVILGSFIINYPDTLYSRVTITTNEVPIIVKLGSTKKISKVFFNNYDTVQRNEPLMVFENSADYHEIMLLKESMNKVKDITVDFSTFQFTQFNSLGNIQQDYINFKQAINNYVSLISNNFASKKNKLINSQIHEYKALDNKLYLQLDIVKQENKLFLEKYNRNIELFKKGLVSDEELARSNSEFLQKKFTYYDIEQSIINNKIQINKLETDKIALEEELLEKQRIMSQLIVDNYAILTNSISKWEESFLIKSPIEGQITFVQNITEGAYLDANDEILSIAPLASSYKGKLYIPISNSGKVFTNQMVVIKLDNFPYNEFGTLEGKITKISNIPINEFYIAEISVDIDKYSIDKSLNLKTEMHGNAEIILNEKTIAKRFIQKIFNVLE